MTQTVEKVSYNLGRNDDYTVVQVWRSMWNSPQRITYLRTAKRQKPREVLLLVCLSSKRLSSSVGWARYPMIWAPEWIHYVSVCAWLSLVSKLNRSASNMKTKMSEKVTAFVVGSLFLVQWKWIKAKQQWLYKQLLLYTETFIRIQYLLIPELPVADFSPMSSWTLVNHFLMAFNYGLKA